MHGEPLDEVIYCEVMFDQGISGEIPEHRTFIYETAIPRLEKWGIPVTVLRDPSTYVDNVAHLIRRGPKRGMIRGFPLCGRCAIQRDCKARPINRYLRKRKGEVVQYIGIASDEQERLVGAVDTHAFLGCFIPTGFRKLFPNLKNSPTPTLEALATRLRDASRTRVREVMNTDVCICQVDTPAREIAADLAERNAVKCYVVDKEGRLTGVISLAQFFRRILRD